MIKNKKIILFVFVIIGVLMFPFITHAETHVYNPNHREKVDWVWNKEGSPYILEENISIMASSSIRIEEGVDIMSASTSLYNIFINGDFTVEGSKEYPVKFMGLKDIFFYEDNSLIKNVELHDSYFYFHRSTSTIDRMTVTGNIKDFGLVSSESHVDVKNSRITENKYGVMLHKNRSENMVNHLKIENSGIYDNEEEDIINQDSVSIDARNNWWGSVEGLGLNEKRGLVDYDPWLTADPDVIPSCCSNVLFIPGLQASRLYKDDNMLWEPNRNEDVRKMSMNEMGISIDPDIYTKDIVDSAFGLKNIYKNFIDSMDSLVGDGKIKNWMPLAYDWRKSAYDVVDEEVLDKVYGLASTSPTRKITIISHSNGGLVAKALMKKLEDEGRSDIVENIIFVAVPELGTTQAILSMLHGYGQSIAGGLILSENTARTFSQNLPGAYGLLPSKGFFENNSLSVIKNPEENIFSYDKLSKFLTENVFSKASSTDNSIPLLLNSYILSRADSFHSVVDRWKPASTTKTLSIFGWGIPTTESVEYEKRKDGVAVSAVNNTDGDGTVLTKSSSENSDSTLFFNLKKLRDGIRGVINHANILESTDLLSKVKDTITKVEPVEPDYEKYFSSELPKDEDKYVIVKIYSPVNIHAYDKDGNHTGPIDNPVVGIDMEKYESNMPGSYYQDFGKIKMLEMVYDENNKIVLEGTGTGVFSADLEVKQFNKTIATTTFSEMPVTPLMTADFIIATSTDKLEMSYMNIDVDGDDIIDVVMSPNHTDKIIKKSTKKLRKIIRKMEKKKIKKEKMDKLQKAVILKQFEDILHNIEINPHI